MAKDAYYFPHDSNARHDPRVVAMRAAYKAEGYGLYWMIIEMMREQEGYHIDTNSKHWLSALSLDTGTEQGKLKEFIDACIEDFELFEKDDDGLFSGSLLRRMSRLDHRRSQARDAAAIRWNKKPKKKTATKKVTIKKEHPNGIKVLSKDKEWAEFAEELLSGGNLEGWTVEGVEKERQKCLDWMKAKGRSYKDYRAMFRNWLKNAKDFKPSKSGKSEGMVY